jgi:hypothetical protein
MEHGLASACTSVDDDAVAALNQPEPGSQQAGSLQQVTQDIAVLRSGIR